jgi:serine/threonine protein kinase
MLDETTYKQSVSHQRRQVENSDRKIEHYSLLKIIGTGTFGKVYLATLDEKPFAVKVLKKRKIIELN